MIPPFLLYCEAAVLYDGRARSTLEPGNYLIVYKPDGSLAIHGNSSIKPLNYMNGASKIEFIEKPMAVKLDWPKPILLIRSTCKKEIIDIFVFKVHANEVLADWSANKISITGTETQLRDHIAANIEQYLGFIPIEVQVEYPTKYGPVDVYAKENKRTLHICEVKRGKISLAGCGQLTRYGKHFKSSGLKVHQHLIAPAISKNALKYATDHNQAWLQADLRM